MGKRGQVNNPQGINQYTSRVGVSKNSIKKTHSKFKSFGSDAKLNAHMVSLRSAFAKRTGLKTGSTKYSVFGK